MSEPTDNFPAPQEPSRERPPGWLEVTSMDMDAQGVERRPDGKVVLRVRERKILAKRYPILGWPIIRGVVNFVYQLYDGMKTLTASAEIAGGGDAYPVGVRDLARRMAEDCEMKVQTLEAIAARA